MVRRKRDSIKEQAKREKHSDKKERLKISHENTWWKKAQQEKGTSKYARQKKRDLG